MKTMMLTPGTKLGPYEIIERIGAGGMGEVYRAHDSRVGRDGIKISSEPIFRFNHIEPAVDMEEDSS